MVTALEEKMEELDTGCEMQQAILEGIKRWLHDLDDNTTGRWSSEVNGAHKDQQSVG